MKKPLHITLAQLNPIVGNIPCNVEKIIKAINEAPDNTDLIVYPEMIVCGYPPEDLVLKPFFMDQVERAVRDLAKNTKGHKAHLVVSSPWRIDGRTYNAVHLIGDGRIIATVAKHHLPNYGVFDENRRFTAGPLPPLVAFKGHRLGLMLCEDMWFPDVAAHLKDGGADILVSVHASPYEIEKNTQRLEQAQARVRETGLSLIYVNQCGGQDELVFDGGSFVLDARGQVVVQARQFSEDTHHTVWKNGVCTAGQIAPAYEGPEAVYKAVVTGLKDYTLKNGFPGVLIGLSGGIDSALTAVIAADALGPDAVHCVMMPSQYTSQESLEDAAGLATALGLSLDTVSIETMVESFENGLAPVLPPMVPGVVFENVQSRCRGLILMALSNATGRMVLSTGNKSEMAVGYTTLYGDLCGGFNVLKDIYKTQVYALSRWRNEQGAVIPERILTKAPTAELKPGQTDQDSLPPYEELDDILHCLIEQDLDVAAIVGRGHAPEIVEKVWRMLDRAEYKRAQSPPGVKITARAFGRDRRYPVTNQFVNIIEKA